jgi:hypothetical protein
VDQHADPSRSQSARQGHGMHVPSVVGTGAARFFRRVSCSGAIARFVCVPIGRPGTGVRAAVTSMGLDRRGLR